MFEPTASWSLPAHLFMVSGWSAKCTKHGDAMSCVNDGRPRRLPPDFTAERRPRRRPTTRGPTSRTCCTSTHVSWGYYVVPGHGARLRRRRTMTCTGGAAERAHAGDLEPAALLRHGQAGRPARATSSRCDASTPRPQTGTLPAVSWVVAGGDGQRAPAGARHATARPTSPASINAVMRRPRLGLDRDLPRLGRLGRLLRPRRPAAGRRERLRPARARARHQPVREDAASSTTRRSASTPTSSSSRTTSSAGSGSTPRPTVAPTRARRCARTRRSSAT